MSTKPLKILAAALGETLFPSRCSACGRLFHPETQSDPPLQPKAAPEPGCGVSAELFAEVMSPFLCRDCLGFFSPVQSPKCSVCGVMFPSRQGQDRICGRCLEKKHHFSRIRSAGQHKGALMTGIHALKYKAKLQLARPLGCLLFYGLINSSSLDLPDVVVPVPLHPSRARKRGFNQAAVLLRHWPGLFRACGLQPPEIAGDGTVVKRVKKTPPQTGLDRAARKTNIRHAFACRRSSFLADKNVLLIDDVCTTGSTADECAGVLQKAGAAKINVLTLARAA